MKKQINAFDYAEAIVKGIAKGSLLTTKAEGRVNTMAISWGTLGVEWNKQLFTTFVRVERFTREMLDKNGEFTVNIPMEGSDMSVVGKCGSVSGRDADKIADNNLTLVEGEKVSIIVYVSKDLHGRFTAPALIKEAAPLCGGSGGGRPDLAQAGGTNPAGVAAAIAKLKELVA